MALWLNSESRDYRLFKKWGKPDVSPTAGGNWRIDRAGTAYWGKGLSWEWSRIGRHGNGEVNNPFLLAELNALVTMRAPVPKVTAAPEPENEYV